ncbi:hypothetical protein [Streptomyces sp. SMS_SU21]|uniref:hypothetical protein n=1 Tax=Streptomyces sp. SMS_SU21 TaxID=2069440 RepID=UPI0015E7F090|nr:hypothetical protein [Streptomyces sp. SMS_SU21]MCA2205317.1 hypothetical protein [Streptomyces sp. SMS_SU21]
MGRPPCDRSTWAGQDGAAAPDGDTRWPSRTFYGQAPADDAGSFWSVGYCTTPPDPRGDQDVHGLVERATPQPAN